MTLPKIEEWIKEVENRPGSALTILKIIAGRLRDLTDQNEALLAENIALQNGSRVEEYRKRIVHLEYQLDLLKRRFGLNQSELEALAVQAAAMKSLSLLVYNALGRILRIEPLPETGVCGQLSGELPAGGEMPRLLAVPANEELLLLFSSGRVSTCAVEAIPAQPGGGSWALDQAALPDEPHAGERLACLMPLSGLALADFFLQASRRGCIKKTMTSMAETVLENHYLGRGAIQRMDQPLDLILCTKKQLFALVTQEGRLLGLNVDELPYSVEEWIKLEPHDHVVAGFSIHPQELLLCVTQTGKVISRSASFIEPVKSSASRGQALIPPARLEQGVRFTGAAAVRETDRLVVLDAVGNLRLHAQSELTGAGVIRGEAEFVALTVLPAQAEKQSKP
jgi:DNA gyrase/topoisomerase IV subunit A